jgi:hypothetical protein
MARLERRRRGDCATLIAILDDGQWHTLTEIQTAAIAISGKAMTVHSRASQLRADGYLIENDCAPFSSDSRYRLVASPDEMAEARSLPSASDARSGAEGSESVLAKGAGEPVLSQETPGSPAPLTEALPPPECRAGAAAAHGGSVIPSTDKAA